MKKFLKNNTTTIISFAIVAFLFVAAFVIPNIIVKNKWIQRNVWTADSDLGEVVETNIITKMELGGRNATPYVFFANNDKGAYTTVSKADYAVLQVGDTIYNVRCDYDLYGMIGVACGIAMIIILILAMVSLKIPRPRHRYYY